MSTEEAKRPGPQLVLIYTWDLLRALLALLGAFTIFGGGVQVGSRTFALPLWVEIGLALASASYAGALILIAVVLGRRQRWVWQAQMAAFVLVLVLIIVSYAVDCITLGQLDVNGFIGSATFAIIDMAALYAMTGDAVRNWYDAPPSRLPKAVVGALVLWAATSLTFTLATLGFR